MVFIIVGHFSDFVEHFKCGIDHGSKSVRCRPFAALHERLLWVQAV